jgi:hypothetical protein
MQGLAVLSRACGFRVFFRMFDARWLHATRMPQRRLRRVEGSVVTVRVYYSLDISLVEPGATQKAPHMQFKRIHQCERSSTCPRPRCGLRCHTFHFALCAVLGGWTGRK